MIFGAVWLPGLNRYLHPLPSSPLFASLLFSLDYLFTLSICSLSWIISLPSFTILIHFRLFLAPFFTEEYIFLPPARPQLFPLYVCLYLSTTNQTAIVYLLLVKAYFLLVPSVLFPLQIIYFYKRTSLHHMHRVILSSTVLSLSLSLSRALGLYTSPVPVNSPNCERQSSRSSISYQAGR